MKHRVRVKVITRKRGLFGTREVVTRKTVTVPGGEACRTGQPRWNAPAASEAERLAALALVWEKELAERRGEDRPSYAAADGQRRH